MDRTSAGAPLSAPACAGLLLAALGALSAAGATAAGKSGNRAFMRFVASWPGDYDNLGQQSIAGMVATRLHIVRVTLPAFGPHVVYAEWRGAADDKLLRQRLYAFSVEPDGRWRLALHIWPADRADFVARTAGAWRDPQRLAGVTPADMVGLAGCDVLFGTAGQSGPAAAGPALAGEMQRGACRIPSPGVNRPVYSWTQMRRSRERLEYRDGWFFADDDQVYRQFSQQWYVFNRSRP